LSFRSKLCNWYSYGDGCIVDAGIAILAGTKIRISADELSKIKDANPRIAKLRIKRLLTRS